MSHVKHYLICYDIRDSRRLRQVHHLIRDIGVPVQLSVFETELKPAALTQLLEQLTQIIDGDEDHIRVYTLGSDGPRIDLGRSEHADNHDFMWV
jgi:CRISPR-associated protein Cas2